MAKRKHIIGTVAVDRFKRGITIAPPKVPSFNLTSIVLISGGHEHLL
jgi:hypothetical protein